MKRASSEEDNLDSVIAARCNRMALSRRKLIDSLVPGRVAVGLTHAKPVAAPSTRSALNSQRYRAHITITRSGFVIIWYGYRKKGILEMDGRIG